jgi:hypothetical protein
MYMTIQLIHTTVRHLENANWATRSGVIHKGIHKTMEENIPSKRTEIINIQSTMARARVKMRILRGR